MAIGDALAAVWMERRGISGGFRPQSPSRLLGQAILTVADLMVWPAITCPPAGTSCRKDQSAHPGGIGSGWVEDPDHPGRLIGLITDGDVRRALRDHNPQRWATLQAKHLMTADPITVTAEVMAVDAIQKMEHNRRKPITVLPVVNAAGELDGLLRLHDLVQSGLA